MSATELSPAHDAGHVDTVPDTTDTTVEDVSTDHDEYLFVPCRH